MTVKLNYKIAGSILIIFSLIWLYRNFSIIYEYRAHPEILRLFWIPEWILWVQGIIGIFGVVAGILIIEKRMKTRIGFLLFGLVWVLGFGTEYFLISY